MDNNHEDTNENGRFFFDRIGVSANTCNDRYKWNALNLDIKKQYDGTS